MSLAYGLNEDVPEYDLDNDDEHWLEEFNKKKVNPVVDSKVVFLSNSL